MRSELFPTHDGPPRAVSPLTREPRSQWLIVAFLTLLLAVVPAASVTAADWSDHLGWLPLFAAGGVLCAIYLSTRRLTAPLAHGAGLATGLVLITLYFMSLAEKGDWKERLLWLGGRVGAWLDVAINGGASSDTLIFALTMSLLAWVLGYAAGWFVFRERAPWWAILPTGSAILLNLSYAPPELLPFLVVYLLAAMLLLVALTLARSTEGAAETEPEAAREAGRQVLMGGLVASVVLLFVAWTLPSGGISQAVYDLWYRLSGPWQGLQTHFDRLFAALNAPERAGRGLNFGRTLAPRAAFELGEQPVLAIKAREPRYWRAATYDRYTGQVFISTEPNTIRLEAEQARPAPTEKYEARVEFEQHVQLLASQTSMIFAADTPERVSLPTLYDYRQTPDDFAALRLPVPLRRGQQYTVISSVSVATVSELRAAGTDYPPWIARYLQLPRQLPARVRQEAQRVTAGADNPFDKAAALESYLRQFRYSTRVKQPPPDRDWVDYMLFESKEGYCDYYAAAMAVMLRAVGIPARVASGFAPGERDASQDLIIVKESHAHSWTEVYFPGYGWITFEPSALRPVPPRLEAFGLDGSLIWDLFGFEDEDYGDLDLEGLAGLQPAADANGGQNGGLPGIVVVFLHVLGLLFALLLLALALGTILVIGWQRSLRSLREHVRPYAQLSTLAAWCGVGRRPSDTPYEYAETLGREVPPARREVQTIAEVYVQGTFGRTAPDAHLTEQAVKAWRGTWWLLAKTLLRRHWRRLITHGWPRGLLER
ncbi:MAG TPA: DUF3488 and transglutaminase-like domain-containing protein [Chloroflexota bacterium]|nr:DUF3488 and transglutaminase-like domain-containing protein [Chloroflexota bacterium]